MSFQIERGLFSMDFIDHHAILGVSVDAPIKDIRKRYLKIARQLHPDSFASESPTDKEHASQILSKLVNPAWERLSQEKELTEYTLLLKLKGQQALQRSHNLNLGPGLAQQLLKANNIDHVYQTSLKDLSSKQYEHLDQVTEMIAQISELNMVYLMRKEDKGDGSPTSAKRTIYTGSNLPDSSASTTAPPQSGQSRHNNTAAPPPQRESLTDQYYRRAESCVAKNNFAQAILELRDALKLDPNNSQCHGLMGLVYLKQKQGTMAKIHFNQALKFDPNNEMARKGLEQLGQAPAKASSSKENGSKAKKADAKSSKTDRKPGSGGLFGMFGKKK